MSKTSLELLIEYIQGHENNDFDFDQIYEQLTDIEFNDISKSAFLIFTILENIQFPIKFNCYNSLSKKDNFGKKLKDNITL